MKNHERSRHPERDRLGVADREHLGGLFTKNDVQESDRNESDQKGDRTNNRRVCNMPMRKQRS